MLTKIIEAHEAGDEEAYCAPDPTPEQIALGEKTNTDPYDRCGDSWSDMPPCIAVAAACVIHDELYQRGGTRDDWLIANANFRRDCLILAKSTSNDAQRILDLAEAVAFADIVDTFSWAFWHSENLNTPVTQAQGETQMQGAKDWINTCANKLGEPLPYPV